jgi:molybdopterin adenylyltransferase
MRIGVLTISDRASAGEMRDEGGPAVESALTSAGLEVQERAIISDDRAGIEHTLQEWTDSLQLDVVFTTGGTGLGPRDMAPEATLAVSHRLVPGISEAIRAASLQKTQMAMLSRGVAAIRGGTLIVNLPGSPRGARESAEVVIPVLPHAVATLHGGKHE